MSRFRMKQRWFSFGNDYKVQDAAGDDVLRIDGKVFCIGDQLSVQAMDGRELAYIDQKLLSWGPTYEIWRNDRLAAVVKKSLFTVARNLPIGTFPEKVFGSWFTDGHRPFPACNLPSPQAFCVSV